MKIKTIQKLISAIKKEIDGLLVTKREFEEKIKESEDELISLKKSLEAELDLAMKERIFCFDAGEFIKHELQKQNDKESEISELNCQLQSLIESIMNKNVEKKTYEHLFEQVLAEERIKEYKAELELIDAYSLMRQSNLQT